MGLVGLGLDGVFQTLRSGSPILHTGLRVDVDGDADAVAALVGGYLRIDFGVMPQAGVRAPHHLEIHPAEPHWFELRLDVVLNADSERCRSAFRTDVDHDSEVMPITVPN